MKESSAKDQKNKKINQIKIFPVQSDLREIQENISIFLMSQIEQLTKKNLLSNYEPEKERESYFLKLMNQLMT